MTPFVSGKGCLLVTLSLLLLAIMHRQNTGHLRSTTQAEPICAARGSSVCKIGIPPWANKSNIVQLEEFAGIYNNRPKSFGSNDGGGSFFHYYALFSIIRHLKETEQLKHIVESGAWNGIGTWFLRQAAGPDVQLIIVSPTLPGTYVDTGTDSKYFAGKDFLDFNLIDWSFLDPRKTLLFMDDHQSEYRRVNEAYERGFRHIMFDDNYAVGTGDNFSTKKVCSTKAYAVLNKPYKQSDNFHKTTKVLTEQQFKEKSTTFKNHVEVYAEFPPVWHGSNRFGFTSCQWKQITLKPILDEEHGNAFIERHSLNKDFESNKYTHISYVKVKDVQTTVEPNLRSTTSSASAASSVTLVCMGDTHTRHENIQVPTGDVLLHSGDFSMVGADRRKQVVAFNEWLGTLPHRHKVVVAGNHDSGTDKGTLLELRSLLTNAVYLSDEYIDLPVGNDSNDRLLRVYGSPWQPQFRGFGSYMQEEKATRVWEKTMPKDTPAHVVLTHSPPRSILDMEESGKEGSRIGSSGLREVILSRPPLLHCFGHVHTPGGSAVLKRTGGEGEETPVGNVVLRQPFELKKGSTLFVNDALASNKVAKDGAYIMRKDGAPIVIQLPYTLLSDGEV